MLFHRAKVSLLWMIYFFYLLGASMIEYGNVNVYFHYYAQQTRTVDHFLGSHGVFSLLIFFFILISNFQFHNLLSVFNWFKIVCILELFWAYFLKISFQMAVVHFNLSSIYKWKCAGNPRSPHTYIFCHFYLQENLLQLVAFCFLFEIFVSCR